MSTADRLPKPVLCTKTRFLQKNILELEPQQNETSGMRNAELAIQPLTIQAWDAVALRRRGRECTVAKGLLDDAVESHGSAVCSFLLIEPPVSYDGKDLLDILTWRNTLASCRI